MTDRIIQITHGWPRSNRSATRLVVAIVLSIAFHGTLLLLQFGEYGEGLPGFELPTTDRRGQLPELHIDLQSQLKSGQQPESNTNTTTAPAAQAALTDQVKTVHAPVETFELVPIFQPDEAPVAEAKVIVPISKSSFRPRRTKPKLVTSAAVNSDFKVAESESGKLVPAIIEDEKPAESTIAAAEPETLIPEAPEKQTTNEQEKAVAEKAAADKINEEKQAQLIANQRQAEKESQDKIAAEKLEQAQELSKLQDAAVAAQAQKIEQEKQNRLALEKKQAELRAEQEQRAQEQARLAAQQAEKLRQDALARQLAQAQTEKAEQEKLEKAKIDQQNAQQARLAERIAEEQRKLAEAVKAEQLRQELAKSEQQERARLAQELAEKQRIEQEEKRRQEQMAEQSRQNELARQAEASREQAAAGQAERDRQRQRSTDLNDILGTASDSNGNAGSVAGAGTTKPDLDKLLTGRTADFDRNGDAIKSVTGTTVPVPKLESSSGARRSIFGSKNGDIDLNLYIQSWRQKVERNGRLNYAQSAKDKAFSDPVVTVSIRRDGTVENIVILRSSGNKEIDEAVRRITILNAPYSLFPPSLARKFDVIDIRQIWVFDEALQVKDEMR